MTTHARADAPRAAPRGLPGLPRRAGQVQLRLYRTPDATLEEAQTAKLHFVAERLGLRGGECLLDIGCGSGWGSLTLFMAEEYGCEVTGVTPSAPQAAYIRERAVRRYLRRRSVSGAASANPRGRGTRIHHRPRPEHRLFHGPGLSAIRDHC